MLCKPGLVAFSIRDDKREVTDCVGLLASRRARSGLCQSHNGTLRSNRSTAYFALGVRAGALRAGLFARRDKHLVRLRYCFVHGRGTVICMAGRRRRRWPLLRTSWKQEVESASQYQQNHSSSSRLGSPTVKGEPPGAHFRFRSNRLCWSVCWGRPDPPD